VAYNLRLGILVVCWSWSTKLPYAGTG